MSDPNKLICGMTQPTAQRYLVVRKELDMLISRVHKAGYWLSEFEKVKPDGLCHTLSMMGIMVMNSISMIHHYLEDEFASLAAVRDGLNNPEQ